MFILNIKNIRKQNNISISQLSEYTNISKSFLSTLENNKRNNVSLNILISIANALKCNVKELFYTIDDIKKLRKEMHRRINKFGFTAKETLEISQLLDLLIVLKMKKL